MESQHSNAPTAPQAVREAAQPAVKDFELIVDRNTEGLEDTSLTEFDQIFAKGFR
jgi:hypothetical protein